MNLFTAFKAAIDIQRGIAKANADIELIKIFETDHEEHHNSDPQWDCHPSQNAFYGHISDTNEKKFGPNAAAFYGYTERTKEWKRANAGRFGNPLFVKLENGLGLDADATPEQVQEKLRQLFQDHMDLQAMEEGDQS